MGSTALFGVVLARTVAVDDFGVYSYGISLASIGMGLMAAGLTGLAIKALIDGPERQRDTMSALILIRESFALVAYAILLVVALSSGSGAAREATAIACLVLFARAFDATEFWFQSRLEARRTAIVRIVCVLLMLAVRLVAALSGASVVVFLALYAVEAVLTSGALLLRYLRYPGSPRLGTPQTQVAAGLLASSWILLLSGIANQVNLRADLVILQALLGSAAVGTYAAAARLSELTYILPVVFLNATFPALLLVRARAGAASRDYRDTLQRSYDQACWIGVAIMVVLLAIGPWLIVLLFGDAYRAAGNVLRIHVLALPFVFMAAVFSKWIIAESLLVASLSRHALGALLNVTLNFLLVPEIGIEGAAVATVVSYVAASYLSCFVGTATRPAGTQMSLALVAPLRLAKRLVRK